VGLLAAAVAAGWGQRFPVASLTGVAGLAIAGLAMLMRLLRACAALQRAVARTAAAHGMAPMTTGTAVRRRWPEKLAWGIRGTTAVLLLGLVSSSLSAIVQRALPAMRPATAERAVGIAPQPAHAGAAIRPVSLTLAVARAEARPRPAPPRLVERAAPIRPPVGEGVITR
jgi:hypothetical protein